MKLKINSREFVNDTLPAGVRRIREFLDAQANDELLSTRNVSAAVNLSLPQFRHLSTDPALADYRRNWKSSSLIWGNPKAIKEFDRQTKSTK